jgi:predicted dehydrogenase
MICFGILGAGRVTNGRYIDVFTKELSGAVVKKVCDKIKEKADAVSQLMKATPCYDINDLLNDSEIQVILIGTESGFHHEHTLAALNAGKHVVVEKPPGMTPNEVRECYELAQAKGLMYAPIFQNRFNPAIKHLKETFDAGRFGKLISATIRLKWCRYQEYYEDGWHGTWKMDGGVINQQAIHHVDALRWVCGDIEEVFAHKANIMNKLEAEDTMTALVKFKSGALGTIEATTAARPEDIEASISILGDNGNAVIGGIALNKIISWNFNTPIEEDADVQKYSQEVPTGYGLSHREVFQIITDNLAKGSIEVPVEAMDAVKTVELVHSLYSSTETNSPVKLSEQKLSTRLGIG